jgi:hypothetical protein
MYPATPANPVILPNYLPHHASTPNKHTYGINSFPIVPFCTDYPLILRESIYAPEEH